MKKAIIIFIPVLLVLLVIIYLFSVPKSENKVYEIAEKELDSYLESIKQEELKEELIGPKVLSEDDKSICLYWYNILSWRDTASIFIEVHKTLSSFSFRDNYFWPKVTMNYEWNYLMSGKRSDFQEVLPERYAEKPLIYTSFNLYHEQEKYYESSDVIIKPEILFHFLKQGYFEVLKKEKDYSIVAFYEPIGKIYREKDTLETMSAKVYVNDASEFLIIPYEAPKELWK